VFGLWLSVFDAQRNHVPLSQQSLSVKLFKDASLGGEIILMINKNNRKRRSPIVPVAGIQKIEIQNTFRLGEAFFFIHLPKAICMFNISH
jgi:hypothetical protein